MKIERTPYKVDIQTGRITHNNIQPQSHRLVKGKKQVQDIRSLFEKNDDISDKQLQELAYEVEVWQPDKEGTAEKLQFGTSFVSPGTVNNEYYMTRGHFHTKREKPEIYWGISGHGLLLLMNEQKECWAEQVEPGSLHHISGHIAHRLINTGHDILTIGACWPLDAGHDYNSLEQGFPIRVFNQDGKIVFKENKGV